MVVMLVDVRLVNSFFTRLRPSCLFAGYV